MLEVLQHIGKMNCTMFWPCYEHLAHPLFFLTLSAADLHWPEMIQAVASQCGQRLSQEDVLRMSLQERSAYLRQNPVTGVRMFQHRLESFFSQFLLSGKQPLGHITDHVIKIEFQMRGSPHAHCLLWVKEAPKLDRDTDEEVCTFIDRYITAVLLEMCQQNAHSIELMKNLQKHMHSDYCWCNNMCRFAFPKAPSTHTFIARQSHCPNGDDIITDAKKVLEAVQNVIATTDTNDPSLSVNDLLVANGLHVDIYMDALKISQKGPYVILKRNIQDVFINACNLDVLHLWGGNTDLQYVLNEIAAVMYVCSYMTNGEKAMGETLKRVAKECRNDDICTQMNKIKKEFLGKRVLGTSESAICVLYMWLMDKSRKVTPVNTNMKDEHVSLPKSKAQLALLHDDDEDVFATSLIDRYAARPHMLQNMCLAKFAVTFDVASNSIGEMNNCDDDITNVVTSTHSSNSNNCTTTLDTSKYASQKIKLKDNLGYMRKRRQEVVLHTRRYKVNVEPEKYYHAKLLLFFPWCREDELISGFTSYFESYMSKVMVIQKNAEDFNDDCDLFNIANENIENGVAQTAWESVAPTISEGEKRCKVGTFRHYRRHWKKHLMEIFVAYQMTIAPSPVPIHCPCYMQRQQRDKT